MWVFYYKKVGIIYPQYKNRTKAKIKKPQLLVNQIDEVFFSTQGGNRTHTSEKTGF